MRSSLAGKVVRDPLSSAELRAFAARAWHERGYLCVSLDEISDDFERQFLLNLGARLYGSRPREI